MNKIQFMEKLCYGLRTLDQEEKQDILYDYEEHFRIGIQGGKSEDEIAYALGDPLVISRAFCANRTVKQVEQGGSSGSLFRTVLATVSLGFFNLVFVLGPFLGVTGILIGLLAAAAGLAVAGGAMMISSIPFIMFIESIGTFFLGVGALCGGVLLLIGLCYTSKAFIMITIRYLKWNLNIITDRRVSL